MVARAGVRVPAATPLWAVERATGAPIRRHCDRFPAKRDGIIDIGAESKIMSA
jgi:hypothetical protein